MSSPSKGTGADYLVRQSGLSKSRKDLPKLDDILIVEDEALDADRLVATLRSMFGYALEVRRARTLNSALDLVLARAPSLVLLDDFLKPSDTAVDSIPMLRRAGFGGPIVVISGHVDRHRRAELLAMGADDTIHKDDLDSGAISELLVRLGRSPARGNEAE
jgi:DNA-binding response OmpR family regulator